MSWDLLFYAAKQPPPPVADMPDDWRGEILGSNAEVRAKLSDCVSGIDWSDPSWGVYDGGAFSVEFSVGSDEPNDGFMAHVRGGGDAVSLLLNIAERCGWFVLDCSQGEWLHHCAEPQSGWRGFQKYRDRVLGLQGPSIVDPLA